MNKQFFMMFFIVFMSLLSMSIGTSFAIMALDTKELTKIEKAGALMLSLLFISGSVVGILVAIFEFKNLLGAL